MTKFKKIVTKKTIAVNDIRLMVNDMLANSFGTPLERQAISNVLEQILRDTGNYRGHSYLSSDNVPHGQLPGVREFNGESFNFDNTDNTRINYA